MAGGVPLTIELLAKALHGQFGSDLLAGMSIVTSVIQHECLAGALVLLMLSGWASPAQWTISQRSQAP